MIIKIQRLQSLSLEQFAEENNLEVFIEEVFDGGVDDKSLSRYFNAYFPYSELKEYESSAIAGCAHGRGRHIHDALDNLSLKISGKCLVFHAFDKEKRYTINVPRIHKFQ